MSYEEEMRTDSWMDDEDYEPKEDYDDIQLRF